MKKNIFITVLAVILPFFTAFSQDADEIINNYFENTGGLAAWNKLSSLKITMVMEMQGMQLEGTMYQKRPDKQRMDISVQGKTIVTAYDGEVGWMINPMMGSEDPQKMPPEAVEQMKEQKFESELLNYKEKGHSIELQGTEEVEGTETYKIQLTKKNGDVEYYFFDTEYYVPIMERRSINVGPTKGQEIETYISDYQEVGEFMMPFFIEAKSGGQTIQKMTFTVYSINEELDDSLFTMPVKSEEE